MPNFIHLSHFVLPAAAGLTICVAAWDIVRLTLTLWVAHMLAILRC